MIAISPVTTANTLEQRLEHLEAFSIALNNHPAAANLYIGYANGDFFNVRRTNNDDLKKRFKAPGDAMYVVDNIDMSPTGKRSLTRLFFNKQLEIIAREPAVDADYDPRLRNWYIEATSEPAATRPYLFYFSGNVGITAKLKSSEPGVVIATDITLDRLADTINKYQTTPNSAAVLINADNQVFAYKDPDRVIIKGDDALKLASMDQLGSDVLTYLSNNLKAVEQDLEFDFDNKQWTGSVRLVARPGGVDLYAVMISPVDELLSEAAEIRSQSFTATIIISLAFIPLIWLVSKRISTPLHKLADAATAISQFEFDTPIDTKSHIKEVHELSTTMELMKTTINRFINLINSLAGEQNLDALLQSISRETMLISNADGVLTYLMNESEDALNPGIICSSKQGYLDTGKLPSITLADNNTHMALFSKNRSSVMIVDENSDNTFKPLLGMFETDHLTMIALPLLNRNYEHIGLLCLLFKQAERLNTESEQASLSFIQALSGFAAVTLESRQLLHMQEALLNSFIKLIAGAIDSKSPYTGSHCQRVPEITRMLARAACASDEPPFDDFDMTDKEWEALDIASWLHDCGKVTTPEYVVDKATKLETIYDRIHEIRMRFEVLKRDAEIMYWQQLAEGGNKEALQQSLSARLQQLDDDFAFIAECNEGGEFMDDEKIERLNRIAQQTWKRTLDDRIGISWEEANRKSKTGKQPLPVTEHLLADKPEHIIERQERDRIPADNPWGFKLDVPENKYNRGELYNLSVSKGTLSAEERYKINDHMTQTIIMLEQLPYPKHLRDVPKIAGCHHETMDGKGYPKRLTRDDMSLTARMMAIADIFEALTASDRPYKKAKTLSEAIRIMSFMRNDNHIDPDLFKLFLTSGVYKKYAERFLDPEQIDNIDINDYL
jgi:HD-GYP domain-containing protein (c-di-GMP phosphodiesterase class II)/HAMP domain-containing protein